MNCPKNSESGRFCFNEMTRSEPFIARLFVTTDNHYMQAFITAETPNTSSNTHLFGIYNSDCNCYEGRSVGFKDGVFIAYQDIAGTNKMQICLYQLYTTYNPSQENYCYYHAKDLLGLWSKQISC